MQDNKSGYGGETRLAIRAIQVVKLITYAVVGCAFGTWFAQQLLNVAESGFAGAGYMLQ